MISYDICRKVLEQDGKQYTDEQVKLIADFLFELAQLSVDYFLNQLNNASNEKSSTDGPGEFG